MRSLGRGEQLLLKQHDMKMSMVTAMVPVQANGAGAGVEGFTSGSALANAINRISRLGGTLDYIGMDDPLIAGHLSGAGPKLSITDLAQQMAGNVALIKSVFPNVQFADGESLITTPDLVQWAQAFKTATGSAISMFEADVNWDAAGGVTSQLEAYAQAARAAGAVFGIMGNSTSVHTTNQSWALAAETNIAAAEADPLIRPDSIHVGTWNANPTVTIPEGLSGTLAHVAVQTAETAPLFADGYLVGGTGTAVTTLVPTPSYVGSVVDAVVGTAVAVPGVSLTVTAGSATGTTFAVVLTDVSGTLGATASGAGHVSRAADDVLLLTGSLADINAELASLTYSGAATGTDTIDVTAYDGAGLIDNHQITVSIAAPVAVSLPANMTAAALYNNIFGSAPTAAALAPVQAALAAGQTLAQAASSWIAQGQSTISALCEQVQGGSATPDAIANLTSALADGASLATIRTALASAAQVQTELGAIYQAEYGVAPTAAQLAALTQQLAAGASLQMIEAPLLANSAAEAQITALYQQVEGQVPDASDLLSAARALVTGTPLAAIQAQLAASAVPQANLAALFQHVYDAPPTVAQLAALTAQLAGTTTYAQIQAQFTAAAQGIVTTAYQSVLNRAPTAVELAKFTTALTTGVTWQTSIYSVLEVSQESAANVTAMYQQVIGQAPPQSMVTTLEQCLGTMPHPITLVQLKSDLATAANLYQRITGQPVTAAALSPLMYDFLNANPVGQISGWVAYSAQVIQIIRNTYQSLFGNGMMASLLQPLEAALQAGTTSMAAVQSSLVAQAAADVPVLSAVVANQSIAENTTVNPFGALDLAESDPAAVETVTMTVSGGSAHFTNWATFTNAAGTVFTRSGTAAFMRAVLRTVTVADPMGGAAATVALTVQNSAGHGTSDTVTITTQALRLPATTNFVFMPAAGDTVAAAGRQTFVLPAGGFGQDTITGFNIAADVIQLPKSMVPDFAGVQHLATAAVGGTMIGIGSSESILLPGVTPGSLHASNFNFV